MLSDACGYHYTFFSVHKCVGLNINAMMGMYTRNLKYNDGIVKQFVYEHVSFQ